MGKCCFFSIFLFLFNVVSHSACCDLEYDAFTSSLASDRHNLNALSETFYPPVSNNPEFVMVVYNFVDVFENVTWYWSAVTSHFLHPYEVFQYISLFFVKPQSYYVGEVELNIPGMEIDVIACAENNSVLQLATQRLKLFAKQQTNLIKFDDNYNAKAYNKQEIKKLFDMSFYDIRAIIICTIIFTVVSAIVIIVGIVSFYLCSKSTDGNGWFVKILKDRETSLYALASISPFVNIYILALTSQAMKVWGTLPKEMADLHDVLNTQGPLVTLLIVDILCTVANIVSLIVYGITSICKCYDEEKRIFVLPFAIFCSLISIIGHSPFIAIAYLNDGYHASSIFIYYSVILFIAFGIAWAGFRSSQDVSEDEDGDGWCTTHKSRGIAFVFVLILLLYIGFIALITCFFVIIPINKSISDAPNRLIGIFESGGFVLGAFIVYKLWSIFKKESDD